jgi:hypothetical protein
MTQSNIYIIGSSEKDLLLISFSDDDKVLINVSEYPIESSVYKEFKNRNYRTVQSQMMARKCKRRYRQNDNFKIGL